MLHVIKSGALDSIQDTGRNGFQHMGIQPNGAMDPVAAQVANVLTGNNIGEAVIEMHFPASAFLFKKDVLIALSGADFGATINDLQLPVLSPVIIRKYSLLQFTKYFSGARCYLSVHGGFNIPQWLGSYSTNLIAKAGGFEGRSFRKDDNIPVNKDLDFTVVLKDHDFTTLSWHADVGSFYRDAKIIRICEGAKYDQLSSDSKQNLIHSPFTISGKSNRMGYRMQGDPLHLRNYPEQVSSAVSGGTIQLLPNGQLIILMADHQTTGGYPRIAHVVSADIPALAQRRINEQIHFKFISHQEAEDLMVEQHHHLQVLQNACTFQLNNFFEKHDIH